MGGTGPARVTGTEKVLKVSRKRKASRVHWAVGMVLALAAVFPLGGCDRTADDQGDGVVVNPDEADDGPDRPARDPGDSPQNGD